MGFTTETTKVKINEHDNRGGESIQTGKKKKKKTRKEKERGESKQKKNKEGGELLILRPLSYPTPKKEPLVDI